VQESSIRTPSLVWRDSVGLPGSSTSIKDNAGATEVQITAEDLRTIGQVFPLNAAQGTRSPDMTTVNQ